MWDNLFMLYSYVFQSVGYELEKKDKPGFAVDLSSSLESQGTLDFILVKNIGNTLAAAVTIATYHSLYFKSIALLSI